MTIDNTRLKNYILQDPDNLGFAPFVANGDDVGVAGILNLIRDGSPTPALGITVQVRKTDILTSDLVEALDIADLGSITAAQISYLQMLALVPSISLLNADGSNTRVLGNLRTIFQNTTGGTRQRINQLSQRFGSEAEKLFGSGTVISPLDVAHALRG